MPFRRSTAASLILLATTVVSAGAAQRPAPRESVFQEELPAPQEGEPESRKVFAAVEQGIAAANIGTFSRHMASQLLVNLPGGAAGYFSQNQAYYLLHQFLSTRRISGFQFSTLSHSESGAFGTGSLTFVQKGVRGRAQVYVALAPSDGRWVITQISMY